MTLLKIESTTKKNSPKMNTAMITTVVVDFTSFHEGVTTLRISAHIAQKLDEFLPLRNHIVDELRHGILSLPFDRSIIAIHKCYLRCHTCSSFARGAGPRIS